MCGIAGQVRAGGSGRVEAEDMRRMLAAIRHRGPDQFGIYLDQNAGLGNARLSIIDLRSGQQPISNEDGTLWIVFNGEVFNYKELRAELDARGHRFSTETDTEVILHLFEELGPQCLGRLNGQFAIAIWNARDKSLFLGRDRLGVRPIFYAQTSAGFFFASEIKAILSAGFIRADFDPVGLDQVFTFWSTLSPRSVFRDIYQIPPGHYATLRDGDLQIRKYWELAFPAETELNSKQEDVSDYLSRFRELLFDATRIRLRADVPVGAYLSGGLDSSIIAAITRGCGVSRLDTFSIAFTDERFDESQHQLRMAKFLGTDHQVVRATHADIGRIFPDVIWHAETPILRTSPAPMWLLSRLVRQRNYKVVLTGEGADEFLGGYDIFKEAKIRRFWAKYPNSTLRPTLFKRLYADIAGLSDSSPAFVSAFFADSLSHTDSPDYSHLVRWKNTRRVRRFYSDELSHSVARELDGASHCVYHPSEFSTWGPLQRAQFLESSIFLSQYLLSSQGDRMGMAHSVEGRFPFLDVRVVEFCAALPARLKLRGLKEKYLLRELGRELLPPEICARGKRAYRAPIHRSFFHKGNPDYVGELLSPEAIRNSGLFNPAAVTSLVKKLESGRPVSETDEMALAGILSTQLVHNQFVANFTPPPSLSNCDDIKVCDQQNLSKGEQECNLAKTF